MKTLNIEEEVFSMNREYSEQYGPIRIFKEDILTDSKKKKYALAKIIFTQYAKAKGYMVRDIAIALGRSHTTIVDALKWDLNQVIKLYRQLPTM